jgi:hypothetical protein
MELSEIFNLGNAKFPPDQMPALMAEMKLAQSKIAPQPPNLPGAVEQVKNAFVATLTAGEIVVSQLVAEAEFDIVLIDRDLDAAGYGLIEWLRSVQKTFYQNQLPLDEEQKQLAEDALLLQRVLFFFSTEEGKKEENIFNIPFLPEWNAVFTVLQKAKGADNAKRIERLGLGPAFRRLSKSHEILGRLLGVVVKPEAADSVETGFEKFTQEMQRLIGAVITNYPDSSEAHQLWRNLILGPFQKHVEKYRERRRKQEQRAAKQETDTIPVDTEATE